MKKIYVLRWGHTGELWGAYLNRTKAEEMANKANEKRTWRHKLSEAIQGRPARWLVDEVEIKD